jgi:hypothetical protein
MSYSIQLNPFPNYRSDSFRPVDNITPSKNYVTQVRRFVPPGSYNLAWRNPPELFTMRDNVDNSPDFGRVYNSNQQDNQSVFDRNNNMRQKMGQQYVGLDNLYRNETYAAHNNSCGFVIPSEPYFNDRYYKLVHKLDERNMPNSRVFDQYSGQYEPSYNYWLSKF